MGWGDARWFLFACALIAASALLTACAERPDSASALSARFPAQAQIILNSEWSAREEGEAFVFASPNEDALPSRASRDQAALRAVFPRDASRPVHFELPGGVVVRVREIGAHGATERAGSALSYATGAGGISYWARTPSGYEEWLLLEAGVACPGAEAAAWEVEGATLRQRGGAIDVLASDGLSALRVTAPKAYAASGREVPVRIAATGGRISIEVDAGCEPALVDPAWEMTPPMITARAEHAAVLLLDGTVLAIGGFGSGSFAKFAVDVYDPATNMWSARAPMMSARARHTATVLPNGKVVVTGGTSGFGAEIDAIEIYDPSTDMWTPGAPMFEARQSHAAALLQNGKILVAGGIGVGGPLASGEVYDPQADVWTKVIAEMSVPRFLHTATLLPDGRVLMWGAPGLDLFPNQNIPCDVYDPLTGTWSAPLFQQDTRQRHTATLLPDGTVLIAGGEINGTTLKSAEVYNPLDESRSFITSPLAARAAHTATLMPNGEVLVAGGYMLQNGSTIAQSSVELFYSPIFRWTSIDSLNVARYGHTATLLPDTRVLVAGGGGPPLASAEVFGKAIGETCIAAEECPSGNCVDGVCCDTACDGGDCVACSQAMGASQDGTCELLTGTPCEDGALCTKGDTCQAGACEGGAPLVCNASADCKAASCDPATGTCAEMNATDGAACPNGACEGGVCIEIPDAGTGGAGGGGVGGGGGAGSGGGAPVEYEEFYVQGGGCDCATSRSSRSGAPEWPLAALSALALLRHRLRRRRPWESPARGRGETALVSRASPRRYSAEHGLH